MTRTVCFVSEKGGVGKTTACFEIAVALNNLYGKKILIIDADYQRGGITGRLNAQLIQHFNSGQMPGNTLFHKFQQIYSDSVFTPDIDVHKSQFGLDFIPADPRLSSVSQDKLPSRRTMTQNNQLMMQHLMIIDDVISSFKENYDYIFIDSHPDVSSLLRSVIYASDYAVSPVKLDLQSAIGVPTVVGEINGVNRDVAAYHATLQFNGNYIPTKFAGAIGMMAREYAGDLKDSEETEYQRLSRIAPMFDNYVTEGDGIRRAAQNRTSVRYISIPNAQKQTAQVDAIALEFMRRCP